MIDGRPELGSDAGGELAPVLGQQLDGRPGLAVLSFAKPVADAQRNLIEERVAAGGFRPVDPVLFHFAAFGTCEYLFAGSAMPRLVFGVDGVDDALRRRYPETITDIPMNSYVTADHKTAKAASPRAIRI